MLFEFEFEFVAVGEGAGEMTIAAAATALAASTEPATPIDIAAARRSRSRMRSVRSARRERCNEGELTPSRDGETLPWWSSRSSNSSNASPPNPSIASSHESRCMAASDAAVPAESTNDSCGEMSEMACGNDNPRRCSYAMRARFTEVGVGGSAVPAKRRVGDIRGDSTTAAAWFATTPVELACTCADF
jgi:hypothetical protein